MSNLDKVLYPATRTTKADVIAYELAVAEAKLPHLAGRPLTFQRYPDGVEAESFYQKRCPGSRPSWLTTLPLSRGGTGAMIEHCGISEPAGLVWAANQGALEFHVPLARAPDMAAPNAVVFDLDPGAPAGLLACAEVGLRLRELFEQLGLSSYPKSSGGKGLQVYVPIVTGSAGYPETRSFAHAVGRLLQDQTPERIVTRQARSERTNRVLVDYYQNHPTKTTVCAYSLRGRERPTVSTPLAWEEVEAAVGRGRDDELRFELDVVPDRIQRFGDLFAPVAEEQEQRLPSFSEDGPGSQG